MADQAKAKDNKTNAVDLEFNGRLITSVDGTKISVNDFQTLKNMEYNLTGIQGIDGHTKINTNALARPNIVAGIHFKKDQPPESHILVQGIDSLTTPTVGKIYNNETAIPAQGNFLNPMTTQGYQIDTTGKRGHFSNAPDGSVCFCNGDNTYIWSGNEYRCGGFINYDPLGTFSYDYTSRVTNTLTDSADVAQIISLAVSGLDANVIFAPKTNNGGGNTIDLSPSAHTITNTNVTAGGPTLFTHYASSYNGTSSKLAVAAHADFNFSDGTWTVEGAISYLPTIPSVGATMPLFQIHGSVNTGTYLEGFVDSNGFLNISFINGTGGQVLRGDAAMTGTTNLMNVVNPRWAMVQNGTQWIIFLNGNVEAMFDFSSVAAWTANTAYYVGQYVQLATGKYGVCTSITTGISAASTPTFTTLGNTYTDGGVTWTYTSASVPAMLNQTGVLTVGNDTSTNWFYGSMDEVRFSKVARYTGNYQLAQNSWAYTGPQANVYVGSTRALAGIKFYVENVNATASSSVSIYYWTGTGWTLCTHPYDGTIIGAGSTTLAQTGWVSFDSTVGLAQPRIVNGVMAYWYMVIFTNLTNAAGSYPSIYYTTVSAPWQPLTDIWDGTYLPPSALYRYTPTSKYKDFLNNVLKQDCVGIETAAVSGSTVSYYWMYSPDYYFAVAGGDSTNGFVQFSAGMYFLVGSIGTLCGFNIVMPNNRQNLCPSSMRISYWNGSSWVYCSGVVDSTTDPTGAITLNESGTVTWAPVQYGLEYTKSINSGPQLYFYRVNFSAPLSAYNLGPSSPYYNTPYIDMLECIPAPANIGSYDFSVSWNQRLLLCSCNAGAKNTALVGGFASASTWNGTDSTTFIFGNDEAIIAAESMFARFGGSSYETLVVCKQSETHIVDGTSPQDFNQKRISAEIGCTSRESMTACDIGFEVSQGLSKHVVVWQSALGPVMFDDSTIFPIHYDIENYWDQTAPECITAGLVDQSRGFYDGANRVWHLVFASGVSATAPNMEMVFDVVRRKWYQIDRNGKQMMGGFRVRDTLGNHYAYGFNYSGYVYRLNYGDSFDGAAIIYDIRNGDIFIPNTAYEDQIRRFYIFMATKTGGGNVTLKYYGDCAATAQWIGTVPLSTQWFQNGFITATARIIKFSDSIDTGGAYSTHSIEIIYTNGTSETPGFEPLRLGMAARPIREFLDG